MATHPECLIGVHFAAQRDVIVRPAAELRMGVRGLTEEFPVYVCDEIAKFTVEHSIEGALLGEYERYFGDDFSDVFHTYREWRNRGKKANSFLDRLLKEWGVREWIGEYSPAVVKRMLNSGGILLTINDDATICNALVQLLLEGTLVTKDRKRAIVCLNRQMSPEVIAYRNYDDPDSAKEMLVALAQFVRTGIK